MDSVLISIKPKFCELIASGKKTVEVRKTRPKIDTPFKCYIYATLPRKRIRCSKYLYEYEDNLCLSNGKVKMCGGYEFLANNVEYERLNGKVIGEFVCDNILHSNDNLFIGNKKTLEILLNRSCLTIEELNKYRDDKNIYAWHISDLVIYDKPKDLSEFLKPCVNDLECYHCAMYSENKKICYNGALKITRPPQSWCYVELLKK